MNHTPGPWDLNNWTVMGNKQDKVQGKIVARTHHDRKLMHVGEAEANARLIVAAPELLEACQIARLFITLRHKPEWGDGCSCISEQLPCASCVWKDLDAAIAKATGGGLTR